ncbi:hypothetical protein DSM107003_29690 [Trichormus variabilis SAG 1403-4b]|uniref:FHA domain-containing protein n=2 Tax=Anabaena variabilis TaxID=264691 RepID=A0A3S1C5Q1_ANAVA|nr:hypothetical protein DSM107003_29690 [Trichormus variabilis SAG 1403-4b]
MVATAVAPTVAPDIPVEVPPLVTPDPMLELLQPDALGLNTPANSTLPPTVVSVAPEPIPTPPLPPIAPPVVAEITPSLPPIAPPVVAEITPPLPPIAPPVVAEITPPLPPVAPPPPIAVVPEPVVLTPPETEPEPVFVVQSAPEPEPVLQTVTASRTQLQQVVARLFHVQSNQEIELPQNLSVVHIGKPNDRIPPDIDVAGFPNSEIVSRIHADIRVEGDAHYIEDVGSSNGTYINNLPLLPGNRHRLRPGDRISLGKGDLVTFLFQLS